MSLSCRFIVLFSLFYDKDANPMVLNLIGAATLLHLFDEKRPENSVSAEQVIL